MFNIKNHFREAMLALVLCASSLAAQAGVLPSYHVTVNTLRLSGSGFLDMSFNSFVGAPGATATISNLVGAFGPLDLVEGAVANPAPRVFTIGDDPGFNYLSHIVTFGGRFGFDLSFSGDFLTVPGNQTSVFSVALLGADYMPIGNPEGVAVFNVTQLGQQGPASIDVSTDRYAYVSINPEPDPNAEPGTHAAPEPSELLLVLTGLALIGLVARRRA